MPRGYAPLIPSIILVLLAVSFIIIASPSTLFYKSHALSGLSAPISDVSAIDGIAEQNELCRYDNLSICHVYSILNGFYAISFTETFGAESNPTGSPIGGGPGYSEIYTQKDPRVTAVVATKDQLLSALGSARAGDVIFVESTANIDLTGYHYGVTIPAGVTLASDRGNAGSSGARIYQARTTADPEDGYLVAIKAGGANVRITGLRIEGPDMTNATVIGPKIGILSEYSGLEVDNCEIWGWSWSGIHLHNTTSVNAGYFHHNNLYHIQDGELGYAISFGENASGLIEANMFDYCKEAVDTSGYPESGYEARYNWAGPNFTHCVFHNHNIGSSGGKYIKIHHNTMEVTSTYAVGIRGIPSEGAYIHHNVAMHNMNGNSPNLAPFFQQYYCGNMHATWNIIGPEYSLWESGPVDLLQCSL